jgi:Uma2 family endonuclease
MSAGLHERTRATAPLPSDWSMGDLQRFLGDVPAERIRLFPSPGTATEADLLAILDHDDRICELIDGVLLEKDMASHESLLALYLGYLLNAYLASHPIGIALGPDGPLRLSPKRVRIPDVSVIRWERFPNRRIPASQAVFDVVPDLVIEILSQGNTDREMELKRNEYLEAGVQFVWYLAPRARTAKVYFSDGTVQELDEHGTLSGGTVLPGFELPLQSFFDHFPIESN